MRFEFNDFTVVLDPVGPIPAQVLDGEVYLCSDDFQIRAADVSQFSTTPMLTVNNQQYSKPLIGKSILTWRDGKMCLNDFPVYAIEYIKTKDPLFATFTYNDEKREGEIYPLDRPPRWGDPYGAYYDDGKLHLQAGGSVYPLPVTPLAGPYDKGPIPVIYYKGEWSLYVAPKTFKLGKLHDLQISTSPITPKQHGVHTLADCVRPEGDSESSESQSNT